MLHHWLKMMRSYSGTAALNFFPFHWSIKSYGCMQAGKLVDSQNHKRTSIAYVDETCSINRFWDRYAQCLQQDINEALPPFGNPLPLMLWVMPYSSLTCGKWTFDLNPWWVTGDTSLHLNMAVCGCEGSIQSLGVWSLIPEQDPMLLRMTG